MASSSETTEPVGEVAASSGNPTADVAAASYFSPSAENSPYRPYQWYLDGYLTPGSNVNGVNVDKISTKYTGAGIKVGIIDTGFDLSTADLAGRFDLNLSYDPRDAGTVSIMPDSAAEFTWHVGGRRHRRKWRQRCRDSRSGSGRNPGRLLRALRLRRLGARGNWQTCWPVR